MHQYKTYIKMEAKKTSDAVEKQIDIIRKKCEKEGLNIYDVFREAKIPVVTISNWNRKEPNAFDTLSKIDQAIESLKQNV